MRTSPEDRINDYTQRGWWGTDTLHDALEQAVSTHGAQLAVADAPNRSELIGDDPQRLTFGELETASTNLAYQLNGAGVCHGDTVIVQLPNIVELFAIYFAASKLGAIISPVPVQYGPHELRQIAETLRPDAVVTIGTLHGQPVPAVIEGQFDDNLTVLQFGGDLGPRLRLDIEHSAAASKWYDDYRLTNSGDANDILSICWTSGTTGTPKGVPRSHNMWFATARACIEAGDYREYDRLLNPFPMVNMAALGGFLFPSIIVKCGVILHHPLDPSVFLAQMQDEKITFTIAPPALLNQLAKAEEMWNQFDFSSLRSVGSGSAPLSPWMIETFGQSYGIEVINFYGSNEGIGLFCTAAHTSNPEERASCFPCLGSGVGDFEGYAASVVKTRVADPATGESITEPGQTGELLVSGGMVFDGYFDTDNGEMFTSDGYFRTGDLVEICGDPPLFYRIAGRCKDIINRGGMKISPAEIDVLLEALPGVAEAAVCSYPDEKLGERVCACLVMASEVDKLSLDDVVGYLTDKGLAKFKLPERVSFFDALPRNPLGKIQRFQLQAQIGKD